MEAGVDTWRLVRYLDSEADLEKAVSLCPLPTSRGARAPEPVAGHVVGVMPGHRMLWLEGHPAVEGLAPPAALPAAEVLVLDALADRGFPVGRDGGVSRIDGTVTLRFPNGRDGQAVLSGLAALDVARTKPDVIGKPPETVYLLGERSGRKLARVYDKGVEALSAPPGELVRFENQGRYPSAKRRTVLNVDADHVAEQFNARFGAMSRAAEGLTVASLPVIASRLADRVAEGDMTRREAERLGGFLMLHQAGARNVSRRTYYRRRAELRDAGLVVADDFFEPVEIDLGESLDAALSAWAACG